MQKSHPKVVNPRDIAGERKKQKQKQNKNKQTNKQKKKKKPPGGVEASIGCATGKKTSIGCAAGAKTSINCAAGRVEEKINHSLFTGSVK